jgi:hypothetical protein
MTNTFRCHCRIATIHSFWRTRSFNDHAAFPPARLSACRSRSTLSLSDNNARNAGMVGWQRTGYFLMRVKYHHDYSVQSIHFDCSIFNKIMRSDRKFWISPYLMFTLHYDQARFFILFFLNFILQ